MDEFLKSIFPQALSPTIAWVASLVPASPLEPRIEYASYDMSVSRRVLVEGEWVSLAGRIYNQELDPTIFHDQSPQVQALLCCLYSRSHDGYVREHYLRRLLMVFYPWTVPFVMQLVGEYVVEIVQLIADSAAAVLAHESYRRFIRDNPAFLTLLWSRAVSYHDCYYRGLYTPKETYPAFRFLSACCRVMPTCQGTRPTCHAYCAHWRERRTSIQVNNDRTWRALSPHDV